MHRLHQADSDYTGSKHSFIKHLFQYFHEFLINAYTFSTIRVVYLRQLYFRVVRAPDFYYSISLSRKAFIIMVCIELLRSNSLQVCQLASTEQCIQARIHYCFLSKAKQWRTRTELTTYKEILHEFVSKGLMCLVNNVGTKYCFL